MFLVVLKKKQQQFIMECIYSLFTWSKQKWLFWRAVFFFSQSEQSKKFSKSPDWLKKIRLSKKPLLFWSCKQANTVVG